MPHVLVAGKIHPDGLALLTDAPGVTVESIEDRATDAYLSGLPKADGLLLRTQPLDAAAIGSAPNLKIVARHGVGYDAVDVDTLNSRGIPLAIVGDVNSRTVAEHAMMLMLACAKRLTISDRSVREGQWTYRDNFEPIELHQRTLLICGFGRIGRHVAAMATGFGMSILAYDPFLSAEAIRAAGAEPADDLDAALKRADIVTLHAPKMSGEALLGAEQLTRLRPHAIVINTARGGLIDEDAMLAALSAGALAAAGLDVMAAEPPVAGDPLLASNRVILTPHSAGLTIECARRMAMVAAQNILDYFAGTIDPALVVNAEAAGLSTVSAAP